MTGMTTNVICFTRSTYCGFASETAGSTGNE
jgi:hypothetical protein